jgi:hypothetical protein
MGHHGIDPALDHRAPRPERLAPQLGQADVEVGDVVGVEDDPLRIALAEAHAKLVLEPHAAVLPLRSSPVGPRAVA